MRVAVLVSGGVDSSVALARLAREGRHELTAFYLKIWLEDELASLGACPWEEDLGYVRAVCEPLGVPVEVVALQRAYHEAVVKHAVDELARGRTPSPDVLCNSRVKFGAFLEAVDGRFDAVASGHYARVDRDAAGLARLSRAPDPVKDQSYFLSRLRQDQVARLLCPIGELRKAEVRELAAAWSLPTRDRPDSQGICFLGRIPYPEFVRSYLGDRPGDIVDVDTGRVLGRHRGLWFHTIGQRRGLRLGGGPWFVVDKDLGGERLLVAHASRAAAHHRADLEVDDLHWIAGSPPEPDAALTAKLRHGPALVPCHLDLLGEDRAAVHLASPDQGVAPGQIAVFYDGEVCLGSGVIR